MLDEKGNEIDLDTIDAVGKLTDGSSEVWLNDGSRVITMDRSAFDLWMQHVRSKGSPLVGKTFVETVPQRT
jgi:hypothetical protein